MPEAVPGPQENPGMEYKKKHPCESGDWEASLVSESKQLCKRQAWQLEIKS